MRYKSKYGFLIFFLCIVTAQNIDDSKPALKARGVKLFSFQERNYFNRKFFGAACASMIPGGNLIG